MKVKNFKSFYELSKQVNDNIVGKNIPHKLEMTLGQFKVFYKLLSGEEWTKKGFYMFTFMGIPIKYGKRETEKSPK